MVGAVERLDASALDELKACRLIVRRGVGLDNVDLPAATRAGIPVAFVPDATVEEVSDHALALLLALERRIMALDTAVRGGASQRDPTSLSDARRGIRRFDSLTLGIVGLGRIGAALARKAQPIYGSLVAFDPALTQKNAPDGVEVVAFRKLLARSDHVSLHTPLTPRTRHLIDGHALADMRAGSYLVNTARGGLIDEDALQAAIEDGHIGGAGLDVTEDEPLAAQSSLLNLPNVLVTGHSALISDGGGVELRRRAVDAIERALGGLRPLWIANPEVFGLPHCRWNLAATEDGI